MAVISRFVSENRIRYEVLTWYVLLHRYITSVDHLGMQQEGRITECLEVECRFSVIKV